MRFPQEFFFALSGEAEGVDADQDDHLLAPGSDPVDKIFQAGKGTAGLPFRQDPGGRLPLEVFDMHEPHVDIPSFDAGQVIPLIDARQEDVSAAPPGLVEIDPGAVESAEIIDHRHHKFERVVGFQVEALVTFHGIGGRMGLGKGIAGEGADLSPHLIGQFIGVAFFPAVAEEFFRDPFKFLFRTVLSAHGPAQHIGIGQVEAGKMVADLDHIFLEHHHAIGLFQLFLHDRVEVFKSIRVMEAFDVFLHHSRFGDPRPDDRAGGHQADVIVAPELLEQSAHGRALDIEASVGFPRPELFLHLFDRS